MLRKATIFVFCITVLIGGTAIVPSQRTSNGQPDRMVYIPASAYTPLYGIDSSKVRTDPFYLDQYPVTNAAYYQFVKEYPEWNKQNAKPIFTDKAYLRHWPGDVDQLSDLEHLKNKPVVNVSWFAAKAYCECQGKRLATVNEWELVALASETRAVGAEDPEFYQKVLDWYSKPSGKLPGDVGSTFKNFYGVYDMYGLVWEWVLDFNTAMVGARFGKDANLDENLFCGSGAAGATESKNYVAFMRYAYRSSLKASYSVGNLGFRCAKDTSNEQP